MMVFRKQHGFSLVAAIFLLVVLSALGAYMVTIGGTNRATTNASIQGARVYQAARSGMEWAIFLIDNATSQALADTACDANINANSFSLNVSGLNGFTINTTCSRTTHSQGGTNNVSVYTITSIATSSAAYGNADYVRRRLTATISPVTPP